jgi:hypothetical protein
MSCGVVTVTALLQLPSAWTVFCEVDDAEGRLEQKAGEHTRRNDYPFHAVLRPQEVSHVKLLIEKILCATPTNDVVVDAELPGEVTLHASIQRRASEFELDAAPGYEAIAANHGVEPSEIVREVGRGVGDEVAREKIDAE